MTTRLRSKAHRALEAALRDEGFEILGARPGGKHLHLQVRKHGVTVRSIVAFSPKRPEEAVDNELKRLRRATGEKR